MNRRLFTATLARLLTRIALAVAFAALVPAAQALADDLRVFAAASLKDVLEDAAKVYADEANHSKVVFSLAASSALAKQIENGAPADVFISADTDWMDYVAKKGFVVADSRIDLTANRLVLIAPADSAVKADIAKGFPLASLLGSGRLAIADPDFVPAGRYAKAALRSLDVWGAVQGRLARSENVRAALALVSRAEAPLGIVYATDARADPKVRVVGAFPADSHPPIVYPAAVINTSTNPYARSFLEFLAAKVGQQLFAKHGFLPPP